MPHDSDRPAPLTADEYALVKTLRPAMAALTRAFDANLHPLGLTHAEYVALMFLSEAEGRALRLGDLAELCHQSASHMGRTVQRLQSEGLVVREQCSQDARSFRAVLTDAGLARLERAWPVHIAGVRHQLFDQLEGIDLGKLAAAFQRIVDAED
ncbi:MarR family transcriptional regulator [Streptomyces sp. ME02-8801-2C]|uniref:MarR family winged helix-turn-helix transcriptional regulator n=1 Tax=Streptomyces sp. ME02-8801-2C TaxID=3028680 RepID=UPI0029B71138|nr:MarR family transcriptional regulator [Streptomyces sp. ME02-8801-2C]MDX3453824.1 MarR family transcriptional regulator [Streptomyces sp. ME02-8801-2C]